jgi:hypothetical protein
MKGSEFFKLNWQDLLHGLFVAIAGAILTGLFKAFQTGSALNWPTLQPVLIAAIASGLAYLSGQLVTNSQGELMKSEYSPKVLNAKDNAKKLGLPYGKIILIALLLSGIGIAASAQGLVYKPCAKDFIVKSKNYGINQVFKINQDSVLSSLNKWDIVTGMNAVGLNLKTGSFSGFSSAGFGFVRSQYKLTSDKLTVYKTFSYGGMILFGDTNATSLLNITNLTGKTDVGIMAVGGLGPVSLGPTYFVVSKTLLINFQLTWTIQ